MVKIKKKVIVEEEKKDWWPEETAAIHFDRPGHREHMVEFSLHDNVALVMNLFERCETRDADDDDHPVYYAEKVAQGVIGKKQVGLLISMLQKYYDEMQPE